jgi:hypothetical protein
MQPTSRFGGVSDTAIWQHLVAGDIGTHWYDPSHELDVAN